MNIRLEHVHHIFMEKTPFETKALNDVTVSFEDGSFSAVIGKTGSGKSTLVQHINGLYKPNYGSLFIGDQEIHSKTKRKVRKALRKKVGMVFQYPEHQLFEDTVEKDILFGPKNAGFHLDDMKKKLPELLEKVGLDESVLERSPFDLSGGQMRRTAIAGVLAMEPDVLILDEPTAGLDPEGQEAIMSLFNEWHREKRTTIIMITHQMEEVSRLAETVIVMDDGRIQMQGTPDEIFRRESEVRALELDVPERVNVLKHIEKETGMSFSSWTLSPKEAAAEMQRKDWLDKKE
ncbi:energy-coupling factor transport system ATP-binding protein [Salibacterium salarium]|uniref:energy-coupling factor transporter ATPase n=1 Tax=Salibacterium salarium TaxID=284579 RepID=UPI00277D3BB4|nr:energy-coupling factor transporter ATPase [Salibacterium salarium]MDQ0300868.1 energy-coupling factor transport system ATP-binding protein [Salibacterium salarium]